MTYGPAGSNLTGTSPMRRTARLGDPLYYVVTAQLAGSGEVHVSILINGRVISQSTATGGYNIASAEVGKDPITGQWVDDNTG